MRRNVRAARWVDALEHRADRLHAHPRQVDAQSAEAVRAGKFKNVSASFYPDRACERNDVLS